MNVEKLREALADALDALDAPEVDPDDAGEEVAAVAEAVADVAGDVAEAVAEVVTEAAPVIEVEAAAPVDPVDFAVADAVREEAATDHDVARIEAEAAAQVEVIAASAAAQVEVIEAAAAADNSTANADERPRRTGLVKAWFGE